MRKESDPLDKLASESDGKALESLHDTRKSSLINAEQQPYETSMLQRKKILSEFLDQEELRLEDL